ncbi:MAG: DUF167 domain-containing protein [Rhodospirillales bacterium]|nr:DUF167 domain-containing protein [Rhodospirillales bacterium]
MLNVLVAPKASRERIEGLQAQADGGVALKVAVNAPPEGGKANAAVAKLLAKTWRLPKSAFSIRTGAKARRKTIFIEGDAGELAGLIKQWVEDKK